MNTSLCRRAEPDTTTPSSPIVRMMSGVISSSPTLCGFIRNRSGAPGIRTETCPRVISPCPRWASIAPASTSVCFASATASVTFWSIALPLSVPASGIKGQLIRTRPRHADHDRAGVLVVVQYEVAVVGGAGEEAHAARAARPGFAGARDIETVAAQSREDRLIRPHRQYVAAPGEADSEAVGVRVGSFNRACSEILEMHGTGGPVPRRVAHALHQRPRAAAIDMRTG